MQKLCLPSKGFTLVELSIVLVIIGLLVGGILVARSMIDSAKIIAQINQFQQFDIVVSQFKATFNSLPGDSKSFPSTGIAGNNDGKIGCLSGGAAQDGPGFECTLSFGLPSESGNFWPHMFKSGMFKDSYAVTAPNSTFAGVQAPAAKAGQKGALIAAMVLTGRENFWLLCKENGTTANADWCSWLSNFNDGGGLRPKDALSIDMKIDDGLPWQGNVLATAGNGSTPTFPGYGHGGDIYGCAEGNASTDPLTKYRTTHDKYQCNLMVRLQSMAGSK